MKYGVLICALIGASGCGGDDGSTTREPKRSGCTVGATTVYLDADGDGFGVPEVSATMCGVSAGWSANSDDCDDACASCYPGASEICGDGLDNNCEAGADERCECAAGDQQPCGVSAVGECRMGTQSCVDGLWDACSGDVAPKTELCNNKDDNCDEQVDNNAVCTLANATSSCIAGVCAITTCSGDYDDCNNTASDGCEVNLAADVHHCGDCTASCAVGYCVQRGCQSVGAIAAARKHVCVIKMTGEIYCWGAGWFGQLGDGNEGDSVRTVTSPVKVAGIDDAMMVSAGDDHTCAVHSDGTVSCWGDASGGRLGDGEYSGTRSTPFQVPDFTDVVAVSTGYDFTCALKSSGSVFCWGYNGYGQLGDNSDMESATPVEVMGLSDAIMLSAGGMHVCALRAAGTIVCWGKNDSGELGNGTKDDSFAPVQVTGIADATMIALGYGHSCALRANGHVSCWGNNWGGMVGNGQSDEDNPAHPTPVSVVSLTNAVSIAAGESSSCALLGDGTAKCWGNGAYGSLGNHDTLWTGTPTLVQDVTGIREIEVGNYYTCVRDATAAVKCWGSNACGQLGNGETDTCSGIGSVEVYEMSPVTVLTL